MSMRQMFSALAAGFTAVFILFTSQAYAIEKGTVSIGGSSNLFFASRNYDKSEDIDTFSLSVSSGYFIKKDLEFGASLYYSYFDNTSMERRSYSFTPFITYHLPLDDSSDIFFGAGFGYGRSRTDPSEGSSYGDTRILSKAYLGWEYFISSHVALNFSVSVYHVEWDLRNYAESSDSATSYQSSLGITAYLY